MRAAVVLVGLLCASPVEARVHTRTFEVLGLTVFAGDLVTATRGGVEVFDLVTFDRRVYTTDDGLAKAAAQRFAAIITDLGRAEGPQAGYDFLDKLRAAGNRTPAFIYAASNAPGDAVAATQHGAQGNTNDPEQLFRWVMEAVAGRLPSVAQP